MSFYGGGGSSGSSSLGSTVEISEMESLAKGVLIVGDGSGAPRTFGPGADGTVLVFDSAEPAGVRSETIATGSAAVKYQLDVTSGIITAREFTLPSTPSGDVWVNVLSVGDQEPGTDYVVSGDTVSWGPSGGLFDVLAAGDVLIVEYVAA